MTVRFSVMSAIEILDSRGRPTLRVHGTLSDGRTVRSGVPSGASTGSQEAIELRDHDASRYSGQGVQQAVAHVNGPIAEALTGRSFSSLDQLDGTLRALDGTANKSRLGANSVVGASMAAAQAFSLEAGQPLWRWLTPDGVIPRLPVPHFNVVNGGMHAANELDFQEFMIAPIGAPSLPEAIRAGVEVYHRLRALLAERGFETGLGDEGGFAPEIAVPEEVLALLVHAISDAGYTPGLDGVAIALDPASSEFYREGRYTVGG